MNQTKNLVSFTQKWELMGGGRGEGEGKIILPLFSLRRVSSSLGVSSSGAEHEHLRTQPQKHEKLI